MILREITITMADNQLNALPVVKQRNLFADFQVYAEEGKKGKQTTNAIKLDQNECFYASMGTLGGI